MGVGVGAASAVFVTTTSAVEPPATTSRLVPCPSTVIVGVPHATPGIPGSEISSNVTTVPTGRSWGPRTSVPSAGTWTSWLTVVPFTA